MSGRRWIYVPGMPSGQRLVEVSPDWRPPVRGRVAIHGVKADFKSHADGKHYSDSRTYEREVRARGYEIAGNDIKPFIQPELPRSEGVIEDLQRAAQEIGIG